MVFSYPATWQDGLQIAGKTAIIYFFLIAGLRVLGKRELGQMTVYDLVLMIVLANAVQNAMVGDDNTLFGGLISATTLILLNFALRFALRRSHRLEHLLVGEPIVLVNDGVLRTVALERESISREQILEALREHGLERIEEAHLCVLEVDGSISVIPSNTIVHRSHKHYRGLRLN
jgi:uncharacterized membrane protein YcaP (DUF421 family)